ncbi:hypothetical protein L284_09440 [Novosphingobium lindaniclasticum LE124]|uniref:Uncharacterized protein n=1 Tax=Novosphingobium lindaniclasticum LE124 TaxID=1096930 RepID=T0HWH6_9SPHN|nr:hypothetical protein L284_09440 [Novosphingobium lindaniclasticum LE124]
MSLDLDGGSQVKPALARPTPQARTGTADPRGPAEAVALVSPFIPDVFIDDR